MTDNLWVESYDSYLMTHLYLTYLTRENGGRRNKDGSGSGLWYTLKGVTNELTIELSLNWINFLLEHPFKTCIGRLVNNSPI